MKRQLPLRPETFLWW